MQFRRINLRSLAVVLGMAVVASALGQQEPAKDSPIDTERPDFTNTPMALGFRKIQLETGFTYAKSGGVKSWDGPEALLRYGFHPTWEVELGLPNYLQLHDESGTTSGFGDVSVSIKHTWTKPGAPIDFGTVFYTSAPTGKTGFTSGAWDGGVLLLAQGDLGHNWGLGTMLQLDQITQDGAKNQQAFLSASFGYQLNEKTQPFFEIAGLAQHTGGQSAYFQTGFLYRTDNDHQWDMHLAFRLDGNQSLNNIGVGYSVRF